MASQTDFQRLAAILGDIALSFALGVGHWAAAAKVSALILQMATEQRTTMTDSEWGALLRDDDVARRALQVWLDENKPPQG